MGCALSQAQHKSLPLVRGAKGSAMAEQQSATEVMQVVIPMGVKPGETFIMHTPNGATLSVAVPPGVEPGTAVRVAVPTVSLTQAPAAETRKQPQSMEKSPNTSGNVSPSSLASQSPASSPGADNSAGLSAESEAKPEQPVLHRTASRSNLAVQREISLKERTEAQFGPGAGPPVAARTVFGSNNIRRQSAPASANATLISTSQEELLAGAPTATVAHAPVATPAGSSSASAAAVPATGTAPASGAPPASKRDGSTPRMGPSRFLAIVGSASMRAIGRSPTPRATSAPPVIESLPATLESAPSMLMPLDYLHEHDITQLQDEENVSAVAFAFHQHNWHGLSTAHPRVRD